MDSAWSLSSAGREPDIGPADGPPDLCLELGESFESFYLREFRSLVALAHALTGVPVLAEDVAQEAMLATYRRWDEVAEMDHPAAWARRVCANVATSAVRRRVIEARSLLRLRREATSVGALEPEAEGFWAEVRRLPRRQAQAVALYYVYSCPVAEVARVMACSPGAVKTHLSRGRAALAQRLGEDADEELTS